MDVEQRAQIDAATELLGRVEPGWGYSKRRRYARRLVLDGDRYGLDNARTGAEMNERLSHYLRLSPAPTDAPARGARSATGHRDSTAARAMLATATALE